MGRLPRQAKGRLRECVHCGFWFPERDFRMRKRDGKWVCKWDYDELLESERQKSKG